MDRVKNKVEGGKEDTLEFVKKVSMNGFISWFIIMWIVSYKGLMIDKISIYVFWNNYNVF